MKKILFVALCLSFYGAYADPFDFTYTSTHGFISVIQDPTHYCYPPNPPEQHPFSNYFGNDKCYYQFVSGDCSQGASVIQFDKSNNPNQTNNNQFFSACNTPNSTLQLGPQFLLWVDSSNTAQIDACILLANQSTSQTSQTKLTVYLDPNTPPNPSIHVPGCAPNEVGILNLQFANPKSPPTYQIICHNIQFGTETTRSAVISDLNGLLNNNYKLCPTN